MGRRQVRVIPVSKAATAIVLAALSGGMVWLLYFLSGKAYAADENSLRSLAVMLLRPEERGLSRSAILASLMPLAANALLFVPWGFLAFILLDRRDRRRATTYLWTVAAGVVFALAVYAGQSVLPTRVTTLTDCLANAAGVLAGATLGHMRKDVRVRFHF